MAKNNYINKICAVESHDSPLKIPTTDNDNYTSATTALQECYDACQKILAFNTSKEKGTNFPHTHLKHLHACSEICEFTARMILKGNAGTELLCEIATRICKQCADSCEVVEEPSMKGIAELCRKTAEACLNESHVIKKQAA